MQMRLMIVGSRGRIGSAVARRFAALPWCEVTALDRAALPLDDPAEVRERLDGFSFDVLVNCAAITGVDACEQDSEAAWAVNALAPEAMADICRRRGARMVHLSTDYVFQGENAGLRVEEEPAQPLGQYGKSKLGGEARVLKAAPANLVLRTSWVFGSERPSFPDMILERARSGQQVEAIADKWSSPCYSEDFAAWLEVLLRRPDLGGILHLCNTGSCTWRDYGQAVLDQYTRLTGEKLPVTNVLPMALSSMSQFTARRPIHSAMSCARFTRLTGVTPRPWPEALASYLAQKFAPVSSLR